MIDKLKLKMKSKIKHIFHLIFLILITNTNFLGAHDFFNGGCKNHCLEKVKPTKTEKILDKINYNIQIGDNYSCLNKSLCRG